MPFCYSYSHPEDIGTPDCPEEFDEIRTMAQRHDPAFCPVCGIACKKAVNLVSFNTVFAGSTRAEFLADDAVRESVIAQAEGFRSKTELETAMGQAQDRAKQLGVEPNRILGEKKSPYVGERYVPEKSTVQRGEDLVRRMMEAQTKGRPAEYMKHKKELMAHETHIRSEAAKFQKKLEFKPDKSKAMLQKEIKNSQDNRKIGKV